MNNKDKKLSDFANMTVPELIKWLYDNYYVPVPEEINTVEEAEEAARTMSKYTNGYLHLKMVKNYLKSLSRLDKTNKNLIDLRDTTDDFAEALKLQYQSLSRQITIRKDNLEELHMSDNYTIK